MNHAGRFYDLLLDHCATHAVSDSILIGLVWTLCRSENHIGLCMSPQSMTRTLNWPGELAGKTLMDIAARIRDWEPYSATAAMAAINCALNAQALPESIALDNTGNHPNLAVFDYFLPQLRGKSVVVVGRYPGMECYEDRLNMKVIEQLPGDKDYPAAACEYLLPQADWVFLTASSIPNKTFPRLAELAAHAQTVLMGPTTPWLPQLHEFGIDYLAGIEVTNNDLLYKTIAEGGGKRIFSNGLRYRIAELTPSLNTSGQC